jgi:threonine aldolase
MIDLRSDTCSRPTEAMRRAMVAAEVGDDVYSDDPTVRRLEERTAALLGKEDAVYMVTGHHDQPGRHPDVHRAWGCGALRPERTCLPS